MVMEAAGLPTSVVIDGGFGVRSPVAEHGREALDDVVGLALEQVADCVAAGLSLAVDGRVHTVSATGATARLLDRMQYRTADGPCLAALRGGQPVVCDDYEHETRWPAVAEAARAAGVASSLSLPLFARSAPVGALNLYSRSSGAFDTRSRRAAQSLARHGAAILNTLDRALRDTTLTPGDTPAQVTGGRPASGTASPGAQARALAQLLTTAERASENLWTALRDQAPERSASVDAAAVAQRCLALVQDALTVGAIELAIVLGVPDDQLPS